MWTWRARAGARRRNPQPAARALLHPAPRASGAELGQAVWGGRLPWCRRCPGPAAPPPFLEAPEPRPRQGGCPGPGPAPVPCRPPASLGDSGLPGLSPARRPGPASRRNTRFSPCEDFTGPWSPEPGGGGGGCRWTPPSAACDGTTGRPPSQCLTPLGHPAATLPTHSRGCAARWVLLAVRPEGARSDLAGVSALKQGPGNSTCGGDRGTVRSNVPL